MLHLLGRIDANFLAQIADVVVDGFPQVSADAPGEASSDATAPDQPIQGLLQPPTRSSDRMRFPVDLLVGSAAAELEPSQDSGSGGVNEEEDSSPIPHHSSSSSSYTSPLKDHLLDHMYFASPLSAQFEEEVATISPPLDISLLSNDLMANVGADIEMESIPVDDHSGKRIGRDRGNCKRSEHMREKSARGKRSKGWKETEKEKEARTRRAEAMKRRRRDSSSSSEETVSAAETDSAYDSPTSAFPASPSVSSSSPPPPASPRSSSSQLYNNRSSPMLSSTSKSASSPLPSTDGDRNDLELLQKNNISANSTAFRSDNHSICNSSDGGSNCKSDEEENFGSTLDLDLLNSLLTKDILDEMGQVILDKDLGSAGESEKTSSVSDGSSSRAATDRLGNNDAGDGDSDGDGDLFAGIFGEFTLDASDGGLLNDFDSTEWESTFNEFFPQLNI